MTSPTRTITVSHNAETAHRLFRTPGKCQRIHGHSYRIHLRLTGEVDEQGLLAGIDYGTLKASFRGFIDAYLDHQLLLNENDPFASDLFGAPESGIGSSNVVVHNTSVMSGGASGGGGGGSTSVRHVLPGLRRCAADPTTENLAMWIGKWAQVKLGVPGIFSVAVDVDETPSNAASWHAGMGTVHAALELTEVLGRLREATLAPNELPVRIPGRYA